MGSRPDRRAGFTLLEVLIAFAVAALCLAVLVDGSVAALSAARIARDTQNAVVRARSRLAALEVARPEPGERSGDDGGGFRWRTRVSERASGTDSRSAAQGAAATALYDLQVTVSWGAGRQARSVRLDSTRLALSP